MTFSLTGFPSAICLWCAMEHPSLGAEGSCAAKNNSRTRSHPKIHLSCSVSHCGFSQQQTPLPGPVMLTGAATNVSLFLFIFLQGVFLEGYEVPWEFKGELIGGWLVSHNIGCFSARQGKHSWQETGRTSVVRRGLARRGRMLGMVDSCTTGLL